MPVRLLDVNVLLPLLWANHPRHPDVRRWFREHRADGWATCPITQLGFIRISCIPNVLPSPATVVLASAVLRKWTEAADHDFWPADIPAANALVGYSTVIGHQQLTDAYLLALTQARGGVLVTFDRGLHGRPGVEALL